MQPFLALNNGLPQTILISHLSSAMSAQTSYSAGGISSQNNNFPLRHLPQNPLSLYNYQSLPTLTISPPAQRLEEQIQMPSNPSSPIYWYFTGLPQAGDSFFPIYVQSPSQLLNNTNSARFVHDGNAMNLTPENVNPLTWEPIIASVIADPLRCKEGGQKKRKASKQKGRSLKRILKECTIECGMTASDETAKKRVQAIHVACLDSVLKVYIMVGDKKREVVLRGTDIARKIGCKRSMLTMYLHRHKNEPESGIFQASCFLFKNPSACNLKTGSYFLTENACKKFMCYYGHP